MSTKTDQPQRHPAEFRYQPEDLEPRDAAAEEAAMDTFLRRNAGAINEITDQADAEFARGEYVTLDQAMAAIEAQRQRRRPAKA